MVNVLFLYQDTLFVNIWIKCTHYKNKQFYYCLIIFIINLLYFGIFSDAVVTCESFDGVPVKEELEDDYISYESNYKSIWYFFIIMNLSTLFFSFFNSWLLGMLFCWLFKVLWLKIFYSAKYHHCWWFSIQCVCRGKIQKVKVLTVKFKPTPYCKHQFNIYVI